MRAQSLWLLGFRHRLNRCGACFSEACGILLGSGNEPVSPALAGIFFIIEPPGKPYYQLSILIEV